MQIVVIGAGSVGLAAAITLLRQRYVMINPRALSFLPTGLRRVMRICDLEKILLAEVKRLGAHVEYREIPASHAYISRHLSKTIVVATGSKSAIRDMYFGAPINHTEPKRVVVCSYVCAGKGAVSTLSERGMWYRTLKILEGVAPRRDKRAQCYFAMGTAGEFCG